MPYFVTVSSIVIAGVKFQVQGFYSLQMGKDVRFFLRFLPSLFCVYLNKNEICQYKCLAQSILKYFSAIHQCPNPEYRITDITPNIYKAEIYVSSQYPSSSFTKCHVLPTNTVEPQYNKGPRDWQNVFAITRFVISMIISIYFAITGVKKIVRYTKDFVKWRFFTWRFHSNTLNIFIPFAVE